MPLEVIILLGLALLTFLLWKIKEDVSQLEEVVAQMLMDLGEKGILKVEVIDDDGEA